MSEGSENNQVAQGATQEQAVADTDISQKTANQKPQQGDAQQKKQKGQNTNTGSRGRQKKGMIELEPTIGCRYLRINKFLGLIPSRDFYPEDMRFQRWLFDNMRETARLFGFQVLFISAAFLLFSNLNR